MKDKTTQQIMLLYTLAFALGLMGLLLAMVWTKLTNTEREFDTYVEQTLPKIEDAGQQHKVIDISDTTITVEYPLRHTQ